MSQRVKKLPKLLCLCVCLLGLGATQCGPDGNTPAPVEPEPCVNSLPCINNPEAGRCADKRNSKCIGVAPDKECLYALQIKTAGCVCIEGEAKICTLEDGSLGVRMCEVEPDNTTGTRWGMCQPLNSAP